MRLKDKVAIVVGAGQTPGDTIGNGRATAVLFAREGANVMLVDINLESAEETALRIREEGGECKTTDADITSADDCHAFAQATMAAYGRIDILHNNVGIVEAGGPVEADEASWDRVIEVNLKSMYLTCKAVLPVMEAAGRGAIVNIGSVAGIRWLGVPYASYAASKAAILGFTRSIALQYARKGIRANVILPGLMDTPMYVGPLKQAYAGGDIDKMKDLRREQCPMGRMGDAWDVAKAALFLASDEANYITAAELVVDGGLTAKVS